MKRHPDESPFAKLMGQIAAMKKRSDEYFREAAQGSDEAEKHLRVSSVLKELERLGSAFGARAWIACAERMPPDAEWYLIAWHDADASPQRFVGVGWRKFYSDGKPNGWWETNKGLTRQENITHWAPLPDLPPLE